MDDNKHSFPLLLKKATNELFKLFFLKIKYFTIKFDNN